MGKAFFIATDKALNNITSTYDSVWPIAVGLWNLRCMVNGTKKEFPSVSESDLTAKFSLGSGIHGVNYKRAFFETSWEMQKNNFAWIILINIISIYENWLSELRDTIFQDLRIANMQFPEKVKKEVRRLQKRKSIVLENSFYQSYSNSKGRCYPKIDNFMKCYRLFKEARNCYMHNGSKADTKLLEAYKDYAPIATTSDLCVSEVPIFNPPILGDRINLSLRGVVGFSAILIKILVTLDSELLCSKAAEKEFLTRYRKKITDRSGTFLKRVLKSDKNAANRQVVHYIKQCNFNKPNAVEDLKYFLLQHGLLSR